MKNWIQSALVIAITGTGAPAAPLVNPKHHRNIMSFLNIILSSLIAVMSFSSTCSFASPVVIKFEGVVPDNLFAVTTPYTESGFTLKSNFAQNDGTAVIYGKATPGTNSDGTAAFAFCSVDSCNPRGTVVTLTGPASFSLNSIDAATYVSGFANGTIDFIGHIVGGGTVSQTVSIDNSFDTTTFIGFVNLLSVEMVSHTTPAAAIDNIVINGDTSTSVPEPDSLALLGLGLSVLAYIKKRK